MIRSRPGSAVIVRLEDFRVAAPAYHDIIERQASQRAALQRIMDEPLESAPVCSVTIAIDPDGSIRRFATGVMPCEAQKLIGGLRAMITTLSDWQEERVRCGLGCCRESRT